MNLALWMAFLYYIGRRLRDIACTHFVGYRIAVVLFTEGVWSRRQIGDAGAVAMAVYMAGATLRAAYVWTLLLVRARCHLANGTA
jgi:hypothetical protein